MIPCGVLQQVGQFDTGFVNGGEDVDYRLRAALQGIDTRRMRRNLVLHFGGKSTWQAAHDWHEIRVREQHIIQTFRERWGSSAVDLFLRSTHLGPDHDLLAELAVPLTANADIAALIAACQLRDQRSHNVLYQ